MTQTPALPLSSKNTSTAVQFTLQCACVEETCNILRFFFHEIFLLLKHNPSFRALSAINPTTSITTTTMTTNRINAMEVNMDTTVDPRMINYNKTSQLILKLRQKCLMSTVWTLHSILKRIHMMTKDTKQQQQQEEHRRHGIKQNSDYLYKGNDCIQSIFSCIQVILLGSYSDMKKGENRWTFDDLQYVQSLYHEISYTRSRPETPRSSSNMSFLDTSLLWEEDGSLFILLIESCISLLQNEEEEEVLGDYYNSHNNNHTQQPTTSFTYHTSSINKKANTTTTASVIQVASLQIIEILLYYTDCTTTTTDCEKISKHTWMIEKWKLIFPGCFVVSVYTIHREVIYMEFFSVDDHRKTLTHIILFIY